MSNCKLKPEEIESKLQFDNSCEKFDSILQQIIIDSDVSDLSITIAKLSNYFMSANENEDRTYEVLRAMVTIYAYIVRGLSNKSDRNKFDNDMMQTAKCLSINIQAIVLGAKKHLCEKRGNNGSVGKKTSD